MIVEAIFNTVFKETLRAVSKPESTVKASEAQAVAAAVTTAVAPVMVNATNSEQWYQSRVYIGLIVAAIGMAASAFGYALSGQDVVVITDTVLNVVSVISQLIQAVGVAYAAYGRFVGSKKKPLGQVK